MMTDTVLDFRPSRHGFHFPNDWPRGAPARIGPVTLFRIRAGMCGGMCVAAWRSWQDGAQAPSDITAPTGGRLADQIWHAQLASLRLPLGPLRYLWLQLPVVSAATRRRVTLAEALPALRRSIARGSPQVLGLVRTVAWNPFAASRNHQVLAYGYELVGNPGEPATRVEIRIYDPNLPDNDQVRLSVHPDGRIEHPDGNLVAAVFPTGPS